MMMKNETPEDGLHTEYEYFDNGQIKEERNYKNGDLVDKTVFKYSYFTGHLKSEKKYKDGECVSGC